MAATALQCRSSRSVLAGAARRSHWSTSGTPWQVATITTVSAATSLLFCKLPSSTDVVLTVPDIVQAAPYPKGCGAFCLRPPTDLGQHHSQAIPNPGSPLPESIHLSQHGRTYGQKAICRQHTTTTSKSIAPRKENRTIRWRNWCCHLAQYHGDRRRPQAISFRVDRPKTVSGPRNR